MKEVIILGMGPSAASCPFDAEVWTTSRALPDIKGECSKVFAFDKYEGILREGLDIAKSKGIPIVSLRDYATEDFPYNEIVKEFKTVYFKNTVSYMLAYALYLGYEKIRLYGIDQGPEWMYLTNKPYVTFWLGVASGRGVEWEVTKTSILFRAMGEHIRKKYLLLGERKDFVTIGRSDRDPYCFVNGVDPSAITVKTYNDGKEVAKWYYKEGEPNYLPPIDPHHKDNLI